MLPSRSLRWTGVGISNGRQRLSLRTGTFRNYSNALSKNIPRSTRFPPPPKISTIQQTRSISLFGWGGSSKPLSETNQGTSPTADIQIGPSDAGLDNVRAIRASHATSDAPDPTQAHFHPPNSVEPKIIEDLQEKITLPHGKSGEKIADIVSGNTDISSTAESLGYLKDVCGLDFGWGPSTVMENLLEWLHVGAGLSWTASIIAVATILRLAMVKPIIDSQLQGKKMRELQPYSQPLRQKYMQLMQEGNRVKAAQVGAELKELNSSAGISYTRAFVPLLIQLPFSFGAFRVLRNAGQLPVPAFVTEDWLWTTDLSFSDPYYITPAISAATIFFAFRMQQQGGQNAMFGPQMLKVLGTALPMFSFIFMSFQPGSVQLYFMTTGIWAFATTAALRQQWFRNWFNLGPLPTLTPQAPVAPAGSAPTTVQVAPKQLPSNIQRIVPTNVPEPTIVREQPQTGSDRSIIDRAMDKVKGGIKDLTTQDPNRKGIFGKSQSDMEKDRKQAAAARYHAQRQIQLGKERDARNQQARGQ